MIIAGKEYGTGSSRDWAAKGTLLLGVRAVIAESFERIHRSNLVGMGVLPLEFVDGATRTSIGLSGFETFEIDGLTDALEPRARLIVRVRRTPMVARPVPVVLARIDTPGRMAYYRHGGILPYVLGSWSKRVGRVLISFLLSARSFLARGAPAGASPACSARELETRGRRSTGARRRRRALTAHWSGIVA